MMMKEKFFIHEFKTFDENEASKRGQFLNKLAAVLEFGHLSRLFLESWKYFLLSLLLFSKHFSAAVASKYLAKKAFPCRQVSFGSKFVAS